MKLGVQLFGCMKYFNENPEEFLRQLKARGYEAVEPCVSFGDGAIPFAWHADSIESQVQRTAAAGLTVDSFHSFAGEFWNMAGEHADVCCRGGFQHVVLGYRDAFTREAADEFIAHCRDFCDAMAGHGIGVWLHNSWQEVRAKIDGISAYEYILRGCEGKLGAQVDTGWVVCGGENLKDFLNRNAEYVKSLHHKDVESMPGQNNQTNNVPLGAGIVNTLVAYEFGIAHNLPQLVDQDFSQSVLIDDLAMSAAYLNSLK